MMEITTTNFVILALAVFGMTHILTTSVIADGFRTFWWSKFSQTTKLGYVLTCNWCTGFWVSLFFIAGASILPQLTFVISLLLALYAAIGLLSAWLER